MTPTEASAIVKVGGRPALTGHTLAELPDVGLPQVVAVSCSLETIKSLAKIRTNAKRVQHVILSTSNGQVTEVVSVVNGHIPWLLQWRSEAPGLFQGVYNQLKGAKRDRQD